VEGSSVRLNGADRPTPAIHGNELDAAKQSIDWIGEANW
jgi:hypothetical protein